MVLEEAEDEEMAAQEEEEEPVEVQEEEEEQEIDSAVVREINTQIHNETVLSDKIKPQLEE